jgi:hypothetical protein
MKTIEFDVPNEVGVIILDGVIDDTFELKLAFDTAATHTTLDSNMLHILGYGFKNKVGSCQVETSNGIIFTDIFKIERFEIFGEIEHNFEVQVYDFIAHGIASNYDGVIGLDFLKKRKFCLDISNGILTIPK